MSDEQRKDEDTEVEAHKRHMANDEPAAADDDDENDVEAHKRHMNNRMD